MKKLLSLLAVVLSLGLSTVALDADAAKRMGSGKSLGTQRQATPDKAPTAAPAAAATPAAAAAAAPKRSWMGPLAGLAAGLGLAALASHLGFGDELASMVMMGLVAAAIMLAVGFFLRKRAAGAQPMAAGGLQPAYAGAAPGQGAASYRQDLPAAGPSATGSAIGSAIGSSVGSSIGSGGASAVAALPAGFDAAGFEHNAKLNFVRLQAANDAGKLDDIRQFTTPALFAELQAELGARGGATQKTAILGLDAKVMEVVEEADAYVVSVRFNGVLREASEAADESFDEVWHLTKPRQGDGGWLLAGIQQLS